MGYRILVQATAVILLISMVSAQGWSLFGGAADDKSPADAKQALADTAKALGWRPPVEATDMPGKAWCIEPQGMQDGKDKVCVSVTTEAEAKYYLQSILTEGIPPTTFHGYTAGYSKKGQNICDAGGATGWFLWFFRTMFSAIPGVDTSQMCATAEGNLAWTCKSAFFAANSPDQDDNTMQLGEELYNNARKRGICDADPTWARIIAKMNKTLQDPLTPCEMIYYLRKIEDANPRYDWRQIISKLHRKSYPKDIDLQPLGVTLFLEGKENEGYEKVNTFESEVSAVPKFINDDEGRMIDVAHSYAGLRSLVNRGNASSYFVGKMNTQWGDYYQIGMGIKDGTLDTAGGSIKSAWYTLTQNDADKAKADKQITDGIHSITHAGDWLPPDQERGNELGMKLIDFFKTHPKSKLSEAYKAMFLGQNIDMRCGDNSPPKLEPEPQAPAKPPESINPLPPGSPNSFFYK
jgi:hypothetical protein